MDEYISKTKFEELMRKKARSNFDLYYVDKSKHYYEKAIGYNTAADEAHDFPSADVQPVNQWISVDDKLPEWDKTVLVWYASDTLFGVGEGYGISWYHGSWRLNDLNGENIRIFYWQYLPEKPKNSDTG